MIMKLTRLVFSGSGGQGVITAAIILAEAAVIYSCKNATQTQAYGAAARGGATRSDVIISEGKINYPGVIQPNILVTLTQDAYTSFADIIRPGGLLLTDPRFVETAKKVDAKKLELPIYEQVMEKIGKPIVYNICTLGALIGITQLLEPETILKVLKKRIPKDFMEMNTRAFDLGLVLGQQYQYRTFN
jgi:2-oxoglutarate ferredoxin oxidoreductase subunit gamma